MAQTSQDSRPGQMIFYRLAKKNDQLFWGGVAMAIVGGLGSLTGVIAGSLLFAVLPELLRGALQWLPLAYSGTFLLVILFLPGGLAQLWEPTL